MKKSPRHLIQVHTDKVYDWFRYAGYLRWAELLGGQFYVDPELIHRGKATRYLETNILFMEEIRRSPPGMYKNSVKNGIFAIATG